MWKDEKLDIQLSDFFNRVVGKLKRWKDEKLELVGKMKRWKDEKLEVVGKLKRWKDGLAKNQKMKPA